MALQESLFLIGDPGYPPSMKVQGVYCLVVLVNVWLAQMVGSWVQLTQFLNQKRQIGILLGGWPARSHQSDSKTRGDKYLLYHPEEKFERWKHISIQGC